MMTFTIGQRVRIVAPGDLNGKQGSIYDIQRPTSWISQLFGEPKVSWSRDAISVGVHPKETAYLVDIDGIGKYGWTPGPFGYPAYWLRPLEDPKAAEFIEGLKKLAREPQLAPVTTEHGTALFPK